MDNRFGFKFISSISRKPTKIFIYFKRWIKAFGSVQVCKWSYTGTGTKLNPRLKPFRSNGVNTWEDKFTAMICDLWHPLLEWKSKGASYVYLGVCLEVKDVLEELSFPNEHQIHYAFINNKHPLHFKGFTLKIQGRCLLNSWSSWNAYLTVFVKETEWRWRMQKIVIPEPRWSISFT